MRIDGLALRRLRQERQLSQARLARAAGISQPFVSYLERGMVSTKPHVAAKLATVLGAPIGDFARQDGDDDEELDALADQADLQILAMDLDNWWGAIQPVSGSNLALEQLSASDESPLGDLVSVLELDSHTYYVAIDGEGVGTEAAVRAALALATVHGAFLRGTRGIVSPEALMEAVGSLWTQFGEASPQVALWIGQLERAARVLRYASMNFPAPYLRSEGTTRMLRGQRHAWGNWNTGSVELAPDAILVVATDGIAHHSSKSGQSLWESPELRRLIDHATDVGELAREILRRARTQWGLGGPDDDQTLLVVRP